MRRLLGSGTAGNSVASSSSRVITTATADIADAGRRKKEAARAASVVAARDTYFGHASVLVQAFTGLPQMWGAPNSRREVTSWAPGHHRVTRFSPLPGAPANRDQKFGEIFLLEMEGRTTLPLRRQKTRGLPATTRGEPVGECRIGATRPSVGATGSSTAVSEVAGDDKDEQAQEGQLQDLEGRETQPQDEVGQHEAPVRGQSGPCSSSPSGSSVRRRLGAPLIPPARSFVDRPTARDVLAVEGRVALGDWVVFDAPDANQIHYLQNSAAVVSPPTSTSFLERSNDSLGDIKRSSSTTEAERKHKTTTVSSLVDRDEGDLRAGRRAVDTNHRAATMQDGDHSLRSPATSSTGGHLLANAVSMQHLSTPSSRVDEVEVGGRTRNEEAFSLQTNPDELEGATGTTTRLSANEGTVAVSSRLWQLVSCRWIEVRRAWLWTLRQEDAQEVRYAQVLDSPPGEAGSRFALADFSNRLEHWLHRRLESGRRTTMWNSRSNDVREVVEQMHMQVKPRTELPRGSEQQNRSMQGNGSAVERLARGSADHGAVGAQPAVSGESDQSASHSFFRVRGPVRGVTNEVGEHQGGAEEQLLSADTSARTAEFSPFLDRPENDSSWVPAGQLVAEWVEALSEGKLRPRFDLERAGAFTNVDLAKLAAASRSLAAEMKSLVT
ncbi:unnamed protein product [Amoebophrya sp. A25]|nr:unnamed protein product [Amoebophrya sp. A25]|eukprot:GSA25T00025706001.1